MLILLFKFQSQSFLTWFCLRYYSFRRLWELFYFQHIFKHICFPYAHKLKNTCFSIKLCRILLCYHVCVVLCSMAMFVFHTCFLGPFILADVVCILTSSYLLSLLEVQLGLLASLRIRILWCTISCLVQGRLRGMGGITHIVGNHCRCS